jgi:soluble P-type ATPase
MYRIEIPGRDPLELEHLLLDVNGTLTEHGELIEGVAPRLRELGRRLHVLLLSADTFGSLEQISARLDLPSRVTTTGAEKVAAMRSLGAESCAAIGNGRNDQALLEGAALGIAVLGPEGAAGPTLLAADVVCRSISEALDLLLDGRALAATLRA